MNRKENRQINFRVSDDEYERLERMAKEVGMSVPNFCKKKAHGSRMKSPKINREAAFDIARQLRGIGNNVNQLTKRANENKTVPKEEVQEIQKELQGLWQQFNEALQK
ncbi:MobC family plasmid mobilization relaxosome protein [Oceanobacillus sp. CF4.6]|uniref:MobC family plasmid mobilization relaxosome protein n=1 Tax=Oceanobacillus sp. CF4.6 TaxID=3373080 RepID=UPI003EE58FE4